MKKFEKVWLLLFLVWSADAAKELTWHAVAFASLAAVAFIAEGKD